MSKHSITRQSPLKALRLSDLMGGINLRDSVNMINDNQMTECLNMWWADGTLRTRSGTKEKLITEHKAPLSENGELINTERKIINHNSTREINGITGHLYSVKSVYEYRHTNMVENTEVEFLKYKTTIDFYWTFGDNVKAFETLILDGKTVAETYFPVWHGDILYCFVSGKQIHKYDEGLGLWKEVEETEKYIPLVAAHCKANGGIMNADEVLQSGVMYEGYNLLSDYYKLQYETFNYEAATGTEGSKSHRMWYFFLNNISSEIYKNYKVIVKHIIGGTTYEHSVELNETYLLEGSNSIYVESGYGEDGLKLKVDPRKIMFYKNDGSGNDIEATVSENTPYSTIEIIAPFIPDNREKELERLFKMKTSCWYGGSAEGMNGGTRLFLCGNEEEKALVMWSGRENPLYFPENSYFYVGDKSGAVTGFGKQQNLLVIFKNFETWATQYTRSAEITAKELINQSVVDYTSSSVYFPLLQINPSIGCMYPNTIALCRNRLVWLSGEGKVYTLVTENQYNERSIFCVSEMVKPQLMEEFGTPTATDWNEHYVLSFGNRLYLMDYNSYGYQYITSYSKSEDANLKIPWYYWELPRKVEQSVITETNGIMIISYVHDNKTFNCVMDGLNDIDYLADQTEHNIECYFTTKLFDFDFPSYKKNIQLVNLLLGSDGKKPIKVELVTERGNEAQEVELDDGETNLRSAGYITNKAVIPCIKAIRLLGVKVSTSGKMAVDGMQFNYRILGGIR